MTIARLALARGQILAVRRIANGLEERLPPGPGSLRRAAWAGLQDSVPRAALLSIHARIVGTTATTWEDPALVQLWGPRFAAYVVAAEDLAVFSLGRLPTDEARRRRAEDLANALDDFLAGRRLPYGDAGHGLGVHPNMLRYAAPTGRVLIRWDGARQPVVWTVPRPEMDPAEARFELARRFLHVFGPATAGAFARWAGISRVDGPSVFQALGEELTAVQTPTGPGWILASDEAVFRAEHAPVPGARLLPSGDAYFLVGGVDRELLVPDRDGRSALWTPRVWPGAVLLDGELVGTWRRAGADVTIAPWRRLSTAEQAAVQGEAESLPIPGVEGAVRVRIAN